MLNNAEYLAFVNGVLGIVAKPDATSRFGANPMFEDVLNISGSPAGKRVGGKPVERFTSYSLLFYVLLTTPPRTYTCTR